MCYFLKEVYYGICASLRINKVHTKFYKLPKSGVNRPNSKQDTAIWKCHNLHWRNVWPSGRCTHVGRQNSNASSLVWQNNKERALHGNRNDSGVLSINNLCLLNDVAKIDSGSRYWGLSAGKFSLKSKQFFLLTQCLSVRKLRPHAGPRKQAWASVGAAKSAYRFVGLQRLKCQLKLKLWARAHQQFQLSLKSRNGDCPSFSILKN